MTITRVQYPEICVETAKEMAKNYFVFHRNEVDFLSRGFKAIPSLFQFAFMKEMVDEAKEKNTAIMAKIDAILETYETNDMAGTLETNVAIQEEFGSLEQFLKFVEEAKQLKPVFADKLNPTFDSPVSLPVVVMFSGEDLYKKGSKVLLNTFTLGTGLETDDGLTYHFQGTYREMITMLSKVGFVYDDVNCAMKPFFGEVEITVTEPEETELAEMEVRHELAEFIRVDDDWGMRDFIYDNDIDTEKLFRDESLVSYCIEMDKRACFIQSLASSKDLLNTPSGDFDSATSRAIFSVAYRGLDFNRFLGLLVKNINFKGKPQSTIDEFVHESFHDLRQEMSLDVFNLYKDNIDPKMLALALVKHNNVYRMEIPEMAEIIKQAYVDYKDDILAIPGMVSHVNYYKETPRFIECLRNVPTVMIGEHNVLFYLDQMKVAQEAVVEAVRGQDSLVDLIGGKLATKEEHAQDKLDVINGHISYFEQFVVRPEPEPEAEEGNIGSMMA